MKKYLLFLIFFNVIFSVSAQNYEIAKKYKFNIDNPKNIHQPNELQKGDSPKAEWLAIQNSTWQYTLLNGGYFTVGTNNGVASENIDDNCQITYGHPFAMSSYAFITVDGYEYSPVEFMINENSLLTQLGDTAFYSISIDNFVIDFYIYITTDNNLKINYLATNNSTESHNIGLGLVIDVALGKWGDGYVFYNGNFIQNTTDITSSIPDSLIIWERNIAPKGLGISVDYTSNKPDEILIGNWQNIYYQNEQIDKLFDLALLNKWNETTVGVGENASFSVQMQLLQPEQNDMFLRWDITNALSVENNLLFPLNINSLVQIVNNQQQSNNLSLKIEQKNNILEWSSEDLFSLNSIDENTMQQAFLSMYEIYDSIVQPVTIKLFDGATVIDSLTKNIFIPAAPFSYEGLDVQIDTVFSLDNTINLSFNVKNEETHQLYYNLNEYNIFFYEDATNIENFEIGKDTTGGTANADIIFVLDVTGSMGGEIAEVKNNIIEFADSLSARDVNFRLGMVTFLTEIENIYDFTDDIDVFYNYISAQYAHGGGEENSLDALIAATEFDFRVTQCVL